VPERPEEKLWGQYDYRASETYVLRSEIHKYTLCCEIQLHTQLSYSFLHRLSRSYDCRSRQYVSDYGMH